jgi:hypothetical protein
MSAQVFSLILAGGTKIRMEEQLRNSQYLAKTLRFHYEGSGIVHPPSLTHRLRFFKNFFGKSIFGSVYLPVLFPGYVRSS